MFEPQQSTGQNDPLRFLKQAFIKKAMPHALLFTGIEGIGKDAAAENLAMLCNCLSFSGNTDELKQEIEPCGMCRSCKKIKSGNHPDILRVMPDNSIIRIAKIREVRQGLSMSPLEAKVRIIIISNAQCMNPEASNALLKILEEPPERTLLILTALKASDLLPTILSRCQQIPFRPLSRNILKHELVTKYNADPDTAETAANVSEGSLKRALSMIEPESKIFRSRILKQMAVLSESPDKSSEGLLLAFAERLANYKNELTEALNIISTWFRDLLISKYHPDKIINRDMAEMIFKIARKLEIPDIIARMEALQAAQKDVLRGNQRLVLEVMMMRIAGKL